MNYSENEDEEEEEEEEAVIYLIFLTIVSPSSGPLTIFGSQVFLYLSARIKVKNPYKIITNCYLIKHVFKPLKLILILKLFIYQAKILIYCLQNHFFKDFVVRKLKKLGKHCSNHFFPDSLVR
jgi:hypothetical protein